MNNKIIYTQTLIMIKVYKIFHNKTSLVLFNTIYLLQNSKNKNKVMQIKLHKTSKMIILIFIIIINKIKIQVNNFNNKLIN